MNNSKKINDDIDLNDPEYAEYKKAIESCLVFFSATSPGDTHLTMVSKKRKTIDGKIQLKLVLCTGDTCNMKKFTVSGTEVTEGWDKLSNCLSPSSNPNKAEYMKASGRY